MSNRKRRTDADPSAPEGGVRSWLAGVVPRILVWTAGVILLAALAYLGVTGLRSLLFTANRHFTLREIQVTGNEQVPTAEVVDKLRRFGVLVHASNVFGLRLGEIRAKIEESPLVEEVTVVRRLPGTLILTITERQPVALLVSARRRPLVDDDGWLLPPRSDSKALSLPQITAIPETVQLETGKQVTDKVLLGALKLLSLVATRPDGQYYDIASIQLDYSHPALTVHLRPKGTFREGAEVRVPVMNMEDALRRMQVIVRERALAHQTTGFIDATYELNVPVKP